mmetsp:Transcript_20826/g.31019  ORF Transcript_20826/g.31019 Transcript_20826/m.31019 type:complete len:405 (-) Transcript_20826:50-1264(-)|eukprot:CAMPEP_0201550832 /NCGR_PEP_ID=MMETSP0173_2-20130828/7124_1 /ASSEMBLY_ACC=CAM_ASM_000268 /TAXON_ID=218659 /ORGANISM="Vexillifera sp., Strain DIVA3 564/2" /LENGTH=404 /DNA_ID=CAMNT_0047960921 /DNA_START=36 /DNA_END=1250 /DNA_ORIENTATION=-
MYSIPLYENERIELPGTEYVSDRLFENETISAFTTSDETTSSSSTNSSKQKLDLTISDKERERMRHPHAPKEKKDSSKQQSPKSSAEKQTKRRWSPVSRPKKFEMIMRESQTVADFPEAYEGPRFEYVRMVSETFSVNHVLSAGRAQEPGEYQILMNLFVPLGNARSRRPGAVPRDRVVMMAKYTSSKEYMSRVKANMGNFGASLLYQTNGPMYVFQSELEYENREVSASLSASSMNGVTLSYAQGILPSLVLGCQLNYVHEAASSALAFAARYERNKDVFAINISDSPSPFARDPNAKGIAQIMYAHKVARGITWATRMLFMRAKPPGCAKVTDGHAFQTLFSAGYEMNLPNTGVVKAYVDSNWRVGCMFETQLNQIMQFGMCLDCNYKTQDYKVGSTLSVHW